MSPAPAQAAQRTPHAAKPVPEASAAHRATQVSLHTRTSAVHAQSAVERVAAHTTASRASARGRTVVTRSYGGISCVPFARADSGINVKGNAANWWDNAVGIYARGSRPEAGAVMNFRATGRMRLGHVAVVASVISGREVMIDHSNWMGRGVARGTPVIDVSENNDWSEVRVGLGRGGDFGSVYPTYGFIYNRPDNGVMVANTARIPAIPAASYTEVAEAPGGDTSFIDAPDHSLR